MLALQGALGGLAFYVGSVPPSVVCWFFPVEVEQNRGSPLQLFCLFAAALLFVVSEGGRGQSLISSAL